MLSSGLPVYQEGIYFKEAIIAKYCKKFSVWGVNFKLQAKFKLKFNFVFFKKKICCEGRLRSDTGSVQRMTRTVSFLGHPEAEACRT